MSAAPTISLAGKKILLVDDDPDILFSLEAAFEPTGATIEKAKNGNDAVDLAAKNPPDLLILDLESFSRPGDVRALGELISSRRAGVETLALCPANAAAWLLDLMPHGLQHYCLSPYLSSVLLRRLEGMAR